MPLSNAERQARFRERQAEHRSAAASFRPEEFRLLLDELWRRREASRRKREIIAWSVYASVKKELLDWLQWLEAQLETLLTRRYVTEAPAGKRKSAPLTNAQRQAEWRKRRAALDSRYVTEGGVSVAEVQRFRRLLTTGLKEAGYDPRKERLHLEMLLGNRLKSLLDEAQAQLARFAGCPDPADSPLAVIADQVPVEGVLALLNTILNRPPATDKQQMLERLEWLAGEANRLTADESRYITDGGIPVHKVRSLASEWRHQRTHLESAFTPPFKRRGLYLDRIDAEEFQRCIDVLEQRLTQMLLRNTLVT